MKESFIRSLIRMVEESDIESLEVSSWGRKVRVVKKAVMTENGNRDAAVVAASPSPAPNPAPAAAPSAAVAQPAPQAAPPAEDTGNLLAIKSPMVGTFYSAPSPDSDPYVSINQKVTKGQVVCIVEAMKLMNEIESEHSGRIVKILVENSQPVEFGQELFLVEPD